MIYIKLHQKTKKNKNNNHNIIFLKFKLRNNYDVVLTAATLLNILTLYEMQFFFYQICNCLF